MAEKKQSIMWEHTSHIVWAIFSNSGLQKKKYKPTDFNPMIKK